MAKAEKIQALVTALINKFEEKSNKVTSWSNTVSNTNYPSEKLVKDSLDAKQNSSAKVTSFSATPSDENYPSERLVKTELDLKENADNKISAWGNDPTDTQYPSAKLVKDALNTKLENADLPTKTSDLTNDGDGENPFLVAHQSLDGTVVTLEKQTTAEEGYASTYVIKQGGNALSPKINIPKDQFVQSASLVTVGSTPNDLETSYSLVTGDKYIKLVVNTENSESGATTLAIPVSELVDVYDADNVTIQVTNGQFSIKTGGVTSTELADSAVTTAKIDTGAVTTGKIANTAITTDKITNYAVTADKIATEVSSTWLDTNDVDSEIEDYIDTLIAALNPPASGE